MPGIFLTNIIEAEPDELSAKGKFNRFIEGKSKFLLLLLLLVIPLLLTDWKGGSTIVANLPQSHPDFTGREMELALLKSELLDKRSRGVNFLVLYGEGGIGKTELAIAFANEHLNDFSFIGWIDSSSEGASQLSYAKLSDGLEIREENPAKLRERVHKKLENWIGKPWLLIFDDLRELPSDLPATGESILITCRDKGIAPALPAVEISKDRDQAIALLAKLTGQKPSEHMTQLIQQLDELPLMINIAGHYIAETPGSSIEKYSALLGEIIGTQDSPLTWQNYQKRYSKSLTATYSTTLEVLKKKHPLSFEFIQQVVVLHPKGIPKELLTAWIVNQKKLTSAQVALLEGDILRELKNHSLIRYDDTKNEFSIHHLLYHALGLNQPKEAYANLWIKILSDQAWVDHYNPTRKETIRSFQRVLPHLLNVMEEITTPDPTTVRLLLTVSRYYIETELQLQKGKRYLDKAQQWSINWDHPINGRIAFLQGMLKFREGERRKDNAREVVLFEASADFARALEIFQSHSQDDLYVGIEQNPSKCTKEYQRAICKQFQAQVLRQLGRLEEAEKLFEETLVDYRDFCQGQEHFDIARILREQALILEEKGHSIQALAKLEEAIEMQKRVYGEIYLSQPTVASTQRILGDFYIKRKDYQKADQAYELAIKVNYEIYQNDRHPYLAELYHLRGETLKSLGEFKLGEAMEQESQKIQSILRE